MTAWRVGIAALLLFLLGLPLGLPFLDLLRRPGAWQAWSEGARLLDLAGNTLLLVAGTLLLALPTGLALAVLLYRSDLPGRKALRFLIVLALFVPLPVFASAWQTTLGSGGWLAPVRADWQPWMQGLLPAIFIHALAGLPWAVWLIGQGLCWVERDLEEEALLVTSPWGVFWGVTLPRCRAAVAAAGLWLALQAATEITVTDLTQLRTFAEEVYWQFGLRNDEVLARSVVVSLPAALLVALLVMGTARRWDRTLPPLEQLGPPLCLFQLGRARGPILTGILLLAGLFAGLPIASLIWKAGLGGSPLTWSPERFGRLLAGTVVGKGELLAENLALALAGGVLAVVLALPCCWLAVESRGFRAFLLVLAALAWAMPGPVVGIGLKEAINELLLVEDWLGPDILKQWLYYGPSPVPLLWVSVVRYFPCALAILWPAVRLLPPELRDAARVDGARPLDELLRITLPLTRRVCFQAGLAVAILSLGELSAGKLVETPGSTTLAHVIFEQMHYGVPSDVAGLCLVLLLIVAAGGALLGLAAPKSLR